MSDAIERNFLQKRHAVHDETGAGVVLIVSVLRC